MEEKSDGFFAAEPSCAATCLTDQCPQLPIPKAAEALVLEDVADYGERFGSYVDHAVGGCGCGDLDLAFYEFDGCEDQRSEGAGYGACEPESAEREGFFAVAEAEGEERFAAYAFPEEEGAGFEGGAY
ncbi:hypothetical protein G7Y89_g1194 [Cudoniella acicularis]|uniref:Uncharacterized protein n=1 Tax=Cudoniella acicularis TaxID=354080 RepID=A0A8H4RYN1_9HELO|nr:hypothetical protein G7Y89_g1194 [Cudoniella acicularis]